MSNGGQTLLQSRYAVIMWQIVAILIGFCVSFLFVFLAGESPWNVAKIIFLSGFGSAYDFGMTLFLAVPLVFTGLAVAFAYQAGLFNIGAEGQLQVGALCATCVALMFPELPTYFALTLATTAGVLGGMAWGFLPGFLLYKRGSHEVITTIMLNFVAAALVNYIVLYVIPNADSASPESAVVSSSYQLHHFVTFEDAPVSSAIFMALILPFVCWFLLYRTRFGYHIRVAGKSESAARLAGARPGLHKMWAMVISGGLAGFVATAEILGNSHRFRLGFSADYGFTGIAVALLVKGNVLFVIFSAFLFALLNKGSGDLEFATEHVSKELTLIIQSTILLAAAIPISSSYLSYFVDKISFLFRKFRLQQRLNRGEEK